MIITKLIGGLGNQMFQYALGKKLALKNQDELFLDCSFFSEKGSHTPREFELDVFTLKATLAQDEQIGLFQLKNGSRLASLASKLFAVDRKYKTITEKGHEFHPEVLDSKGNIHLIGYWQSELYFADIRHELLRDFQFATSLTRKNQELAKEIQSCNSVSIHIRRGDYVSNESAKSFHGLCDIPYYKRGIEYLERNESDLAFFVFSDDIYWAQENLMINAPTTFIDHNKGKASSDDMRLMSMCKHHIIANSSFSWWGAWLNSNENKKVIAPQRWFLDRSINTQDVIPKSWIRL